ncbi:MAG: XRE family transcriptional regulator [Pseudomonadota bacterium]
MSNRNNKDSAKVQTQHESNILIESHIGNVIRKVRKQNHLTIAEISDLAEISAGMLSRIERADVSPSLEILEKIAKALGVPISTFFKDYDVPIGSAQHVKKNSGMEVVRRGTKKGHTYRLLAYEHGPKKTFEPFLVVMDDRSEVFPSFQHEGVEFIYILKGKLEYRHGSNSYLLQSGDSLMFSGDVPHGPEKLIKVPIEMLAIINYGSENP